jgi:hypothetical protein
VLLMKFRENCQAVLRLLSHARICSAESTFDHEGEGMSKWQVPLAVYVRPYALISFDCSRGDIFTPIS